MIYQLTAITVTQLIGFKHTWMPLLWLYKTDTDLMNVTPVFFNYTYIFCKRSFWQNSSLIPECW